MKILIGVIVIIIIIVAFGYYGGKKTADAEEIPPDNSSSTFTLIPVYVPTLSEQNLEYKKNIRRLNILVSKYAQALDNSNCSND